MKVLVYGCSDNVTAIADYLEQELPIETQKLITEKSFLEMNSAEIIEKTENDLRGSIGENELIVLADPLDALVTINELKRRHPRQKFVCYGQGIERIVGKLKAIYVLTCKKIRQLEVYQRMKARCQEMEIIESDGAGWRELLKKRWIGREEIMEELKSARGAPIVVFHPDLSFTRIREIVDWRGEVVDMEKALLTVIKAELGLKKWC